MDRKAVNSSQIASIGYDTDSEVLEVEFKSNGAVYQYSHVPQEKFDALTRAPSVGKAFGELIKDKHEYRRL